MIIEDKTIGAGKKRSKKKNSWRQD